MSAKKKRKSQKSDSQTRETIVKLSTQPEAEIVAGENDPIADKITADTSSTLSPEVEISSVIASSDANRQRAESNTNKYAFLVAAGILLSRIVGVVRQRVFAYYFGDESIAYGVFSMSFRVPNFLQNVFGEGALSASFIPVYSKLLTQDEEEANRVAGAVFSILALVTSVIVLCGVLLTPYFTSLIAAGFEGAARDWTTELVRILFPGAGLLVLSAWCLGVLNSHRRFFLSYTAPIIWNFAMIGALLFFGGRYVEFPLAKIAAWGSVAGSFLQFAVQLPTVLALLKRIPLSLDLVDENVRMVLRNFVPVFVSRGVVQISAWVDVSIAGFISPIAVGALNYAQSLYTLPVSLFGMSISAAELPEMSSLTGNTEEIAAQLRRRLDAGLERISFYIVPSAMGFLAFGDVMTATLYQTGKFKSAGVIYVWGILAGSSIGLLASTLGRLYASTFYALHDTRTPLRFAVIRIALSVILGYLCALPLPRLLGIDLKWGAAGLTASAGVAGWIEFVLLRRALNRKIGRTGLAANYVVRLWASAFVGAGVGWLIKILIGVRHPVIVGALVLVPFGLTYFAVAATFGIAEGRAIFARAGKILRRFTGSSKVEG